MADPAESVGDAGSIVATLLARPPALGATRFLAVDGPAGSGKTTLTRAVSAALPASAEPFVVLHMDDLYDGWTGFDEDLERRVLQQILLPIAGGRAARWQAYDWSAGVFDGWHEFAPPRVLVLEGCGSGARAYASYIGVLVWVEADRHERLARGLARDGIGLRGHWLRWMSLEAEHFAANDTAARADVRIAT